MPSTSPTDQQADDVATIRRVWDAFRTGDLGDVEDYVAADYLNHEAVSEPPMVPRRGPESFRGTIRWLRGAFPDLDVEEQDTVASGDRVVTRCLMRGTHLGDFPVGPHGRPVLPATGRAVVVKQVHVFRLEQGRLAEHWAARDDLGMLDQLGILPPSVGFVRRLLARATRQPLARLARAARSRVVTGRGRP